MTYFGDYPASHTAVCMPFDTFALSTGAPTATTNFAAADVVIFKDGGTTQRTSANGITVSTSFDSNTGLQMVVIDLSDNTDAGFYAAGHEFQVAIADITADGQTLRFWLGCFSIERAGGVLAKLISGAAKVDVTKWLTGTIPAVNTTGVPLVDTVRVSNTVQTAGDIPARLPAALSSGNMKSDVFAMQNGVIAALTFSAGAIDAAALAADAGTEIATALLDLANGIETSYTVRQAMRLMLSALAGKLSGAATTTVTVRNIGDSKDRIVATVDSDGNRSAVTLDVS